MICVNCFSKIVPNTFYCTKCGYKFGTTRFEIKQFPGLVGYMPYIEGGDSEKVLGKDENAVCDYYESKSIDLFGDGSYIIPIPVNRWRFSCLRESVAGIEREFVENSQNLYYSYARDFDSLYVEGDSFGALWAAQFCMVQIFYEYFVFYDIYSYTEMDLRKLLAWRDDTQWLNLKNRNIDMMNEAVNGNYRRLDRQARAIDGIILGGIGGVAIATAANAYFYNAAKNLGLTNAQKAYFFNTTDHDSYIRALYQDCHRMYVNVAKLLKENGVNIWYPDDNSYITVSNIINNFLSPNSSIDELKDKVAYMFKLNPYDIRVPQMIADVRMKIGTLSPEEWDEMKRMANDYTILGELNYFDYPQYHDVSCLENYIRGI